MIKCNDCSEETEIEDAQLCECYSCQPTIGNVEYEIYICKFCFYKFFLKQYKFYDEFGRIISIHHMKNMLSDHHNISLLSSGDEPDDDEDDFIYQMDGILRYTPESDTEDDKKLYKLLDNYVKSSSQ